MLQNRGFTRGLVAIERFLILMINNKKIGTRRLCQVIRRFLQLRGVAIGRLHCICQVIYSPKCQTSFQLNSTKFSHVIIDLTEAVTEYALMQPRIELPLLMHFTIFLSTRSP